MLCYCSVLISISKTNISFSFMLFLASCSFMARDREALTKGDLTNCSEHSPADREFLRPVPTQAFNECTNINVAEKKESWVDFY